MKEYKVEIKETLSRIITVNASSEEYAEKIARKMYYKEESIVLDYGDFVDVDFNIVNED